MPVAVSTATVRIFGVDVQVSHLNDGRRIIHADSMAALFEAMAFGDADIGDVQTFAELIR